MSKNNPPQHLFHVVWNILNLNKKLAFATSKYVKKFYYPSINNEQKKSAATFVSCYIEYSKSQ